MVMILPAGVLNTPIWDMIINPDCRLLALPALQGYTCKPVGGDYERCIGQRHGI